VAHVDHVGEARAEEVVLLRRTWAVLHRGAEIAGFRLKSYEILQAEATKNSDFRHQIRRFDVVQAELSSVDDFVPELARALSKRCGLQRV
jgi:hypothetical protein